MDTDTLNENVFNMPEDIEQAQLRIQRNNQGRRLAGLRMKQIQDNLLHYAAPWTQTQMKCVCEAAMSTYDRDRIYQLERELEALRGENVGLRTQLDNGVVTVPQKDQQTLEDVNACLRVIKLMASQNERMQACRESNVSSRLEDALVSEMRQGLDVQTVRLGDYQGGIEPKQDYFVGYRREYDKDAS